MKRDLHPLLGGIWNEVKFRPCSCNSSLICPPDCENHFMSDVQYTTILLQGGWFWTAPPLY